MNDMIITNSLRVDLEKRLVEFPEAAEFVAELIQDYGSHGLETLIGALGAAKVSLDGMDSSER